MTQLQTREPTTYNSAALAQKVRSPEFVSGLAKMLPDAMKPHAERFANQAVLFFMQKPDLLQCTPVSIIRTIQAAAELGFALDGRLAYGIKYKNELTMQLDYKGVLAVVKRCGAIKSACAYVVYENDEFDWKVVDGTSVLTHRPYLASDRGPAIGAYACIKTPNDDIVVEFMNVDEIETARSCSRMRDSLMWTKFWSEGAKKTVLKRALKFFMEDPAIQAAVAADDDFDREMAQQPVAYVESKPPQGRVQVRQQQPVIQSQPVAKPTVAPNSASQVQTEESLIASLEREAMGAFTAEAEKHLRAKIVNAVENNQFDEDTASRLIDMMPSNAPVGAN